MSKFTSKDKTATVSEIIDADELQIASWKRSLPGIISPVIIAEEVKA